MITWTYTAIQAFGANTKTVRLSDIFLWRRFIIVSHCKCSMELYDSGLQEKLMLLTRKHVTKSLDIDIGVPWCYSMFTYERIIHLQIIYKY